MIFNIVCERSTDQKKINLFLIYKRAIFETTILQQFEYKNNNNNNKTVYL